ncbi:putative small ZnF protein [Gambie virus]|uniref:Small ZnF protein n=1 Tax=Gambie virus TaxID=1903427 RepID=A0ABM6DXX7_9MONO|nr:putative small ZnF protein [Gambie virus]AOR51383.1 putative small ZnF protein [Gambie virus]
MNMDSLRCPECLLKINVRVVEDVDPKFIVCPNCTAKIAVVSA